MVREASFLCVQACRRRLVLRVGRPGGLLVFLLNIISNVSADFGRADTERCPVYRSLIWRTTGFHLILNLPHLHRNYISFSTGALCCFSYQWFDP